MRMEDLKGFSLAFTEKKIFYDTSHTHINFVDQKVDEGMRNQLFSWDVVYLFFYSSLMS